MHIINQKVSITVTITQSCVNNYIQLTHKKNTRWLWKTTRTLL